MMGDITMLKFGSLHSYQRITSAALMPAASLMGAVIVGFSSLVRIPIPGSPVPLTLQTFALLACAGVLARGYALQMVAWYILLGIAGAPFFSGGQGLNHLFGPTGGYILGFIPAAFITGYGLPLARTWPRRLALFVLATFAIYVPGLFVLHHAADLSWKNTLAAGFAPFILFDVIKAVGASATAYSIRTLMRRKS